MELKDKNGLTEAEFLAQYDPGDYPRPSVTVDMMVLGTKKDLSGLRILLIKRGGHPYLNSWALASKMYSSSRYTLFQSQTVILELE